MVRASSSGCAVSGENVAQGMSKEDVRIITSVNARGAVIIHLLIFH